MSDSQDDSQAGEWLRSIPIHPRQNSSKDSTNPIGEAAVVGPGSDRLARSGGETLKMNRRWWTKGGPVVVLAAIGFGQGIGPTLAS